MLTQRKGQTLKPALNSEKIEKSKTQLNGGVAQLGEHLPCKQGVMGSNPIISTTYFL